MLFVPIIEMALAIVCSTIGAHASRALSIALYFLSSTKVAVELPFKCLFME